MNNELPGSWQVVSMTTALQLQCNTSASICGMIVSCRTIDFSERLMVRRDDWVTGLPVGTRFRFRRVKAALL